MCADEARKATAIPVSGGERRTCNRSRRASLLAAGLAVDAMPGTRRMAITARQTWFALITLLVRPAGTVPGCLAFGEVTVARWRRRPGPYRAPARIRVSALNALAELITPVNPRRA